MTRLAGKHAFVTGGRQGIGRGIVDAFVNEGAAVTTCGRGPRPDDLPETVAWHTLDVTDAAAVAQVVQPMDILVNNAGVQVEKTVAESTDADWEAVIGPNCRGVFNMCRAFIPVMKRGSIITVEVTSIEDGGVEVEYEGMKSFIRRSDLSRDRAEQRPERFSVGDKVDVRVTNVDAKTRRLGLSIKAREIAEEKEAVEQYGSSDSGASLGDILGAALKGDE